MDRLTEVLDDAEVLLEGVKDSCKGILSELDRRLGLC